MFSKYKYDTAFLKSEKAREGLRNVKGVTGVTKLTIWDLRRYYIITTRIYVHNKYNRIRRIKIYQIEYIIMDLLKSSEIKVKLSCWQISKIKLQAVILLGFEHIWLGFRLALNTELDTYSNYWIIFSGCYMNSRALFSIKKCHIF